MNRDKNSWEKAVNQEILLHVGLGGGNFKQGIGVETRTFRKRKL